jgi:SAM-dependent methyltransferase
MKWKTSTIKKKVVDGEVFFEYGRTFYPERLSQGNAMQFIRDLALQHCKGVGLDIGADIWPLDGSIPIRNDKNQNANKLDLFNDESLDYVFSSHCLEHVIEWEDALKLWIKKLKVNGILFLYLPHESMRLWRVGSPWVNNHKWVPCWEVIIDFLYDQNMKIIDFNADKDEFWSFHIIAKKI